LAHKKIKNTLYGEDALEHPASAIIARIISICQYFFSKKQLKILELLLLYHLIFIEHLSTPMKYTLGQAAKATGKAKNTISRAISKGTITAVRKDNGSYEIDPAELHRVYPAVTLNGNDTIPMELSDTPKKPHSDPSILKLENDLLKERIAELKQDRDDWKKQAQTLLIEDKREKKPFWQSWIKK
jgi:hypothetical protein